MRIAIYLVATWTNDNRIDDANSGHLLRGAND
jgi:hypothetical protein